MGGGGKQGRRTESLEEEVRNSRSNFNPHPRFIEKTLGTWEPEGRSDAVGPICQNIREGGHLGGMRSGGEWTNYKDAT